MQPLVSVIIPTKNSSQFLEACLQSIAHQTYPNIEIIVVDNSSTDSTLDIARRFTPLVFTHGPERSAQRNFGVKNSRGEYVLIIDSDMELSKDVVSECVNKIQSDPNIKGLVIPEESFGEGFWAQCKKLERSFYLGVPWMEAARFFSKSIYEQLGGYNEQLVSGEDWDLSQRAGKLGKIDRINEFIYHNEGKIDLAKTLKKKFYYAKHFKKYLNQNKSSENSTHQTSIVDRYKLFLSQPSKLLKTPLTTLGMLFMKTCEFVAGGMGLIVSKSSFNLAL